MIPRHYGFVFPVKIISGHELSGLPRTLKDAGVSRDQRDEICATAINEICRHEPGRVGPENSTVAF